MVLKLRQSLLITFLKCLTLISKTLKTVLKYGFCNKPFWKDGLLSLQANPPKRDEKYVEKSVELVRGSSLQNDLLQNPYFSNRSRNF